MFSEPSAVWCSRWSEPGALHSCPPGGTEQCPLHRSAQSGGVAAPSAGSESGRIFFCSAWCAFACRRHLWSCSVVDVPVLAPGMAQIAAARSAPSLTNSGSIAARCGCA